MTMKVQGGYAFPESVYSQNWITQIQGQDSLWRAVTVTVSGIGAAIDMDESSAMHVHIEVANTPPAGGGWDVQLGGDAGTMILDFGQMIPPKTWLPDGIIMDGYATTEGGAYAQAHIIATPLDASFAPLGSTYYDAMSNYNDPGEPPREYGNECMTFRYLALKFTMQNADVGTFDYYFRFFKVVTTEPDTPKKIPPPGGGGGVLVLATWGIATDFQTGQNIFVTEGSIAEGEENAYLWCLESGTLKMRGRKSLAAGIQASASPSYVGKIVPYASNWPVRSLYWPSVAAFGDYVLVYGFNGIIISLDPVITMEKPCLMLYKWNGVDFDLIFSKIFDGSDEVNWERIYSVLAPGDSIGKLTDWYAFLEYTGGPKAVTDFVAKGTPSGAPPSSYGASWGVEAEIDVAPYQWSVSAEYSDDSVMLGGTPMPFDIRAVLADKPYTTETDKTGTLPNEMVVSAEWVI